MSNTVVRIGHGRALHLIDAENLCGSSMLTLSSVRRLRADYFNSVPVGPMDQFVLASAHASAFALGAGWPGGEHKMLSGPDGADICLATTVVDDDIARRFDRVYMGSGDGGLAPYAGLLATQGVTVSVVSRIRSLSPRMRLASSSIIYIDRPGITVIRAA